MFDSGVNHPPPGTIQSGVKQDRTDITQRETEMNTTASRYTSPARPPRLASMSQAGTARGSAGVVCLHSAPRRQSPPLVSFEWGRVTPSWRSR